MTKSKLQQHSSSLDRQAKIGFLPAGASKFKLLALSNGEFLYVKVKWRNEQSLQGLTVERSLSFRSWSMISSLLFACFGPPIPLSALFNQR